MTQIKLHVFDADRRPARRELWTLRRAALAEVHRARADGERVRVHLSPENDGYRGDSGGGARVQRRVSRDGCVRRGGDVGGAAPGVERRERAGGAAGTAGAAAVEATQSILRATARKAGLHDQAAAVVAHQMTDSDVKQVAKIVPVGTPASTFDDPSRGSKTATYLPLVCSTSTSLL